MRISWGVISFTSAFAGCASCTSGDNPAQPQPKPPPFIVGMHTQSWDMDVERTLRESAAIGATHSTMSFTWQWIEPEPNRFVWEQFDAILDWGEQYNILIIPQLQYYRDEARTTPDPEDYSRYAGEVAGRYCDHPGFSRIVQIWNEPNSLFWNGTPEEYAAILDAAYGTIKDACPDAVVVGFNVAVSPDTDAWLERAFASNPRFDWFAWHSYGPPPFQSGSDLWSGEPAILPLRSWLDARGYADKPLFNSERGFDINYGAEVIGSFLPQTYLAHLAVAREADVRGLTWYSYHANQWEPGAFAIVGMGQSWHKRPAYCTYRAMTSTLLAYEYERQLMGEVDSTDLQAHYLVSSSGYLLALFAPLLSTPSAYRARFPQTVRIEVGTSASWQLRDWMGRSIDSRVRANQGALELEVDHRIVYLSVESEQPVAPAVDVMELAPEEVHPMPVDPQITAFVASCRRHAQTTPENLMERCYGLETWHRGLVACLGPEAAVSIVPGERIWELQLACFGGNGGEMLWRDVDTVYDQLAAIPDQATCQVSDLPPLNVQEELLGRVPPAGPGPDCDDFD